MKGVKLVIPILSADLLQIPKLCNLYFSLLRQMSIVYPFEVRLEFAAILAGDALYRQGL